MFFYTITRRKIFPPYLPINSLDIESVNFIIQIRFIYLLEIKQSLVNLNKTIKQYGYLFFVCLILLSDFLSERNMLKVDNLSHRYTNVFDNKSKKR